MSKNTKIFLGFIAAAILLGAGYLLFFNNPGTSAVTSAQPLPASAAEITFLNMASKINPITFDTTVLSDPRFTALVDIHTAIVPEAAGRKDPFAPIGGAVAATSPTSGK